MNKVLSVPGRKLANIFCEDFFFVVLNNLYKNNLVDNYENPNRYRRFSEAASFCIY